MAGLRTFRIFDFSQPSGHRHGVTFQRTDIVRVCGFSRLPQRSEKGCLFVWCVPPETSVISILRCVTSQKSQGLTLWGNVEISCWEQYLELSDMNWYRNGGSETCVCQCIVLQEVRTLIAEHRGKFNCWGSEVVSGGYLGLRNIQVLFRHTRF